MHSRLRHIALLQAGQGTHVLRPWASHVPFGSSTAKECARVTPAASVNSMTASPRCFSRSRPRQSEASAWPRLSARCAACSAVRSPTCAMSGSERAASAEASASDGRHTASCGPPTQAVTRARDTTPTSPARMPLRRSSVQSGSRRRVAAQSRPCVLPSGRGGCPWATAGSLRAGRPASWSRTSCVCSMASRSTDDRCGTGCGDAFAAVLPRVARGAYAPLVEGWRFYLACGVGGLALMGLLCACGYPTC